MKRSEGQDSSSFLLLGMGKHNLPGGVGVEGLG